MRRVYNVIDKVKYNVGRHFGNKNYDPCYANRIQWKYQGRHSSSLKVV